MVARTIECLLARLRARNTGTLLHLRLASTHNHTRSYAEALPRSLASARAQRRMTAHHVLATGARLHAELHVGMDRHGERPPLATTYTKTPDRDTGNYDPRPKRLMPDPRMRTDRCTPKAARRLACASTKPSVVATAGLRAEAAPCAA